jgi:pimeloyl-ACP methyl ester carboxylesterase
MKDVTTATEALPTEVAALQRTVLPSGVELHWAEGGQGEPVVFVHGVMGDWLAWAPQWAAFTPHFHCRSYSRRYNHPNRNEQPSPDHSALIEADDLLQLLDAWGLACVNLVASSYGAFAALALAVAHPQRVRRLVVVEPAMLCYAEFSASGRQTLAAFRRDVVEPANAAFRAGDDARGAALMTGGIHSATSASAEGPALQRRLQSARAMRMLALSSNEFPLLPPAALAALPMPVLLVSGRQTPAIHAEVFRNVCAAMPQAAVATVDGAGHGVSRDQPEAFNRLALAFLLAG